METVGFIGLGRMGVGMAVNIHGYPMGCRCREAAKTLA